MSRKLALGVDFGSLSGRALLVDVATGEEVASAVHEYAHGFIEEKLQKFLRGLILNTLQNREIRRTYAKMTKG